MSKFLLLLPVISAGLITVGYGRYMETNYDALPHSVGIGLNLNFTNSNKLKGRNCIEENDSSEKMQSRLIRYGEHEVRRLARTDIKDIRKSGGTWVRSLVWFAPISKLGFSFSADDKYLAANNVAKFGKDLENGGITNWVISFAPQGKSNPSCAINRKYGICYDDKTLKSSLDFITSVRRQLDSVDHPEIWIDLLNEGCPGLSYDNNSQSLKNTYNYLEKIIKSYKKNFPDDKIGVSCIGDNQLNYRLDNIKQIFHNLGFEMNFVDGHFYKKNNQYIHILTRNLAHWSNLNKIPYMIGETNIDRSDVKNDIIKGFSSENNQPMSIIYWPLKHSEYICGVDHEEKL